MEPDDPQDNLLSLYMDYENVQSISMVQEKQVVNRQALDSALDELNKCSYLLAQEKDKPIRITQCTEECAMYQLRRW